MDTTPPEPTVNFTDLTQTVAEPSSGSTAVSVTVTMSSTYAGTVTIPYTVSGTADSGDHDLVNGSIDISSGTSGTINFNVLADAVDGEYFESVVLEMGTPTNGVKGSSYVAGVTITEAIDTTPVDQTYVATTNNELPPTGYDTVQLKVWGGGGGAGRPDIGTDMGGDGGPGGYVVLNYATPLTGSEDIDILVGSGGLGGCNGGTGGSGSNHAGGAGSTDKNTPGSPGAGTATGGAGGSGFNQGESGGLGRYGGGGGGASDQNPTANGGGGGGASSSVLIDGVEVAIAGGGGGGGGSESNPSSIGGSGGSGCSGVGGNASGSADAGGGGGGGACSGGTPSTGTGVDPANAAEAGTYAKGAQGVTGTAGCAAGNQDGTGGKVILSFSKADTTAPEAATTLSWQEGASTLNLSATAQWTKSIASDLASQEISFYKDSNCYLQTGSTTVLGTSIESYTHTFVTFEGSVYFKVRSIDGSGYMTESACSAGIDVSEILTPPDPATNLSWLATLPNPYDDTVLTATWTPSGSSDLATQDLYVYTDSSCSIQEGDPILSLLTSTNSANPKISDYLKE